MAASYRACRPGGCAAKQGPLRRRLIYSMASSMGAAPVRISLPLNYQFDRASNHHSKSIKNTKKRANTHNLINTSSKGLHGQIFSAESHPFIRKNFLKKQINNKNTSKNKYYYFFIFATKYLIYKIFRA